MNELAIAREWFKSRDRQRSPSHGRRRSRRGWTTIEPLEARQLLSAAPALNLLFFGNSFTNNSTDGPAYDMPATVKAIAVADGFASPNVYEQILLGETLADQLNTITADGGSNIIVSSLPAGQTWNDVIQQEYSTRPTDATALEGNVPLFESNALQLFNDVRANSPSVQGVLYETWARGPLDSVYPAYFTGPTDMQNQLQTNYNLAAGDINSADGAGSVTVSPVGEAWRALDWEASLYSTISGDGVEYHPSTEGLLLNAMVNFDTIYHAQVSNIPVANVSGILSNLGLSSSTWTTLAAVADAAVLTPAPAAPLVTTNPQGQKVNAGQPVSFTAAASGSPTPTVQWQVSSGGGAFANITGNASATTTTLTLPGVGTALNGNQYQAVFSNGVGSPATSTAATLTVNPAPPGTFIDSGGAAVGSYVADTDFSGGSTYATTSSINTSADPTGAPASVYQTERWGNFTYTVPNLVAGTSYSVLLHFAEIYWNSAGQRLFNVSINGTQVLSSFDIFAAAGGADKAIVESFNATADANGKITIVFTSVKDNAKVSAIDVVPTTVTPAAPAIATNPQNRIVTAGQNASFTAAASGSPTPTVQWQVSSGGGAFANITGNASATTTTLTLPGVGTALNGNQYQAVFSNGVGSPATTTAAALTVNAAPPGTFIDSGGPAVGSYVADADFSGGSTYSTTNSINTSADPTGAPASVYQTERWGNFTYTVPNLVAGNRYSVLLHFAEIYWNSAGQRLFNVSINGTQVLSSFDIFAAAGGADKAIVESFNATADTNGKITIVFTSVKDNAKISAIDIVPA